MINKINKSYAGIRICIGICNSASDINPWFIVVHFPPAVAANTGVDIGSV